MGVKSTGANSSFKVSQGVSLMKKPAANGIFSGKPLQVNYAAHNSHVTIVPRNSGLHGRLLTQIQSTIIINRRKIIKHRRHEADKRHKESSIAERIGLPSHTRKFHSLP